ncbi:hydantoinase/oxoprolinase family protein [Natronomonas marina]|uniref:hydantoinase/oxoprolinase family protein n=1 Tax=Natronomonas marina TaxID=2961939 RepID=UPI0020C95386|nr:hydantoinase/oxoprolinase family protein [Natronomonas marina]
MYKAGIDIGGTFTDVTLLDRDEAVLTSHKEPTTPDDPAVGAFEGLDALVRRQDIAFEEIEEIVHGTTLVSNTIIEGDGATTGLVTTAGTKDVLGIRRSFRFDLFDWDVEDPPPLVPRHRRIEVDERIDADGTVVEPLDDEEVARAVGTLVARHDVDSIAVSLLHSYANDAHEREIGEAIRANHPSVEMSLSSSVAPIVREYERTSTTVVNAYVKPTVDSYLGRLETALRAEGFEGELYLMTSDGGVVGVETARREPVRLVSSGPAAGLLLSREIGRRLDVDGVLSFDMGGTTAKGGLVTDGRIAVTYEDDVARAYRFKKGSGYTVSIPLVELAEIGAGGGSIATVDEVGLIEVGPRSAGADPGPACYGRGGEEPTVTDAALLLGYVDEDGAFGGNIAIDRSRAAEVFDERIADPLDIERERAAWEVFEVVTENMSNAFRRHATERGVDPSELTMVVQGGAGPMTAFRIAERLRIDEIVCPRDAGVGSALGLVEAPKRYESTTTERHLLSEVTRAELVDALEERRRESERVLLSADASPEALTVEFSLGMRHVNQGAEIEVPLAVEDVEAVTPELVRRRFRERYRRSYNRGALDAPIEILQFRAGVAEEATDDGWTRRDPATGAVRRTEAAYFGEDGWVETDVRNWAALDPGRTAAGPAIVQSDQTSVVVGPRSTYTLENDTLRIRREDDG